MSTCKNCLWWQPANEFNKSGKCGELSDKGYGAKDGLFIPGNAVVTGPNFGCIHGKHKDTKSKFFQQGVYVDVKSCDEHNYKITDQKVEGVAVWICTKCRNLVVSN
jgi:hypothetical protein